MSSRPIIDELETLTPDELVKLLISEVREDSPDVQHIQNLLDVGCPIDARDPTGWTALFWVVYRGCLDLVKLLISNGAQVDIRDNDGLAALHWAANRGHLNVVEFLVQNGAEVEARDDFGRTVLYFAARSWNLNIVKFLISKGADIHARSNDNITPWDLANKAIKAALPELEPK